MLWIQLSQTDKASWPSHELIRSIQDAVQNYLSAIREDSGVVVRHRNKRWVPPSAEDCKIKLITIAHSRHTGYRGVESSAASIRKSFPWKRFSDDRTDLVANCLLCVMSRSKTKVHHPFTTRLADHVLEKVLHFGYLFLGESTDIKEYIVVMKDNFSSCSWLSTTAQAIALHREELLARWHPTHLSPQ